MGSAMTAAISFPLSAKRALTASRSLKARECVSDASAPGTPGLDGTPRVSARA